MTTESNSGYKVPLTTIKEIKEHPNADRLQIAVVYGFEVVIGKNGYQVGDKVIYVPIDSIISQELEDNLFPHDSKIKLTKHRIRQIRIRKFPSQGMLIDTKTIQTVFGFEPKALEEDYKLRLRIEKYEPPTNGAPQGQSTKIKEKKNSHFKEYKGLCNIKWFPTKFKEGEIITVQEKVHGTNSRAGIVPFEANTWWKRLKGLFGLNPKFDKCYGSNRVQLQDKKDSKSGFYGEDIYGKVFKQIDVFSKLRENEIVYGEIYGGGVQKHYNYGCKDGEYKFVLFDLKFNGEWQNPDVVANFAKERGFYMVPELYRGPCDAELIKKLTVGNSVMVPSQKVMEGIAVKSVEGYDEGMGGKRALKFISEKYLDRKDNTDFH